MRATLVIWLSLLSLCGAYEVVDIRSGSVAPGNSLLFYDIVGEDGEWFKITAAANGSLSMGLYCNNAATLVTPSSASAQWSSTRGANYDQEVVISPSSSYYMRSTQTFPNFTCAIYNTELSGSATQVQLTVYVTPNATELLSEQQTAAETIFSQCCSVDDDLSCPRWKATARRANVSVFTDLCALEGSICDDDGNLIQLGLSNAWMSCELPTAALASFPMLQYVYLTNNQLTGDFGAALSSFTALTDLRELSVASNAGLAGVLPSGATCALTSSTLTLLDISGTMVQGPLPDCLFLAESGLRYLVATGAPLSGSIPDAFSSDSTVWQLKLGATGLSGAIPTGLGSVPGLKTLQLNNNSLTGTAPTFEGTSALQSLSLAYNQLSGAVPDALAGHASLVQLVLSSNRFDSLPESWTVANSNSTLLTPPLTMLYLDNNSLTGPFPAALPSDYTALVTLSLANNALTGTLPATSDAFPALRYLYAGGNRFTGGISSSWAQTGIFTLAPLDSYDVNNWNTFSLPSNQLSGDLPDFLAQNALTYPTNIALSGNSFTNGCDEAFNNIGGICGATAPPPPSPELPPPPSPGPDSGSDSGLSTGAKVGIAIGIFIAVLLVIGLIVMCCRRGRPRSTGVFGGGEGRFQPFGSPSSPDQFNDHGFYQGGGYRTGTHELEMGTGLPLGQPAPPISHVEAGLASKPGSLDKEIPSSKPTTEHAEFVQLENAQPATTTPATAKDPFDVLSGGPTK